MPSGPFAIRQKREPDGQEVLAVSGHLAYRAVAAWAAEVLAAGAASGAWGEPPVGRERAQGPRGHDPPPFGYRGPAGWLPGDGPAAVSLLVFLHPVEVGADLGAGEHRAPRELACGATSSGDRP